MIELYPKDVVPQRFFVALSTSQTFGRNREVLEDLDMAARLPRPEEAPETDEDALEEGDAEEELEPYASQFARVMPDSVARERQNQS